jgi:ketosteroid isomerase-like protein
MAGRSARIQAAYAALGNGDARPFTALLAPEAIWLGVPGTGWQGGNPT